MTRKEEIEQTANIYGCRQGLELKPFGIKFFKAGAEWADSHAWKDAQGDNLPEIDREVIALVEECEHYKVCFAHRPAESYTDVSITNHSEMEEYYPERYDKGGWNIPDVKYWLDLELPVQK